MQKPISTKYASNAVACKLWGLVDSPTELLFGLALFERLSTYYERWPCWIYSQEEYAELLHNPDLKIAAVVLQLFRNLHMRLSAALISRFLFPASLTIFRWSSLSVMATNSMSGRLNRRAKTASGIAGFRNTGFPCSGSRARI